MSPRMTPSTRLRSKVRTCGGVPKATAIVHSSAPVGSRSSAAEGSNPTPPALSRRRRDKGTLNIYYFSTYVAKNL